MKVRLENTQEQQKETIQRVQQEPSTRGEATIVDNRSAIAVQRKLRSAIEGSRKSIQKKPKGSSQFQAIASQMGQQYGVDTSALRATHNSSFPSKLHAVATIQGSNIHFAPGMDTVYNIKHEVAHAIDNSLHGTPKGNMVVNGQKVDTTREQVVDRMATGMNHNMTQSKSTEISSNQYIIQRVEGFEEKGNEQMKQKAGTCGIYALANAIAVAYGQITNARYRTEIKNKLLRVAGKLNVHVTAQGEIVRYRDLQSIVNAYNRDELEPNAPVVLERRLAPEDDNHQRWLDTVGEREDIEEEILNSEAVGAMIAIDWDLISEYNRNLRSNEEDYDKQDDITGSESSSGGHWVTIVRINGNDITIHNSHNDTEETYPIWLIQKATAGLKKGPYKRGYFNKAYEENRKMDGLDNNAEGFAKIQTSKMTDKDGKYRYRNEKLILQEDQVNDDYTKMFGNKGVIEQRRFVKDRLDRTVNHTYGMVSYVPMRYKTKVFLERLIVRVKRADNQ